MSFFSRSSDSAAATPPKPTGSSTEGDGQGGAGGHTGLIESIGYGLGGTDPDGLQLTGQAAWSFQLDVTASQLRVVVDVPFQLLADSKPGARTLHLTAAPRADDIDEILMWLGQVKVKLAQKAKRQPKPP